MKAPENQSTPQLLIYGNEWGMLELPGCPSAEKWAFAQCLEKLAAAGFDGCQAVPEQGDLVRSFGLRFCVSLRMSTVADVEPQVQKTVDAGADFLTVHIGWGDEDDTQVDALVETVLAAQEKYGIGIYPETHRATALQDLWRTCRLIERHPNLRLNGDFSHYYCGQEAGYRGFAALQSQLEPVLKRSRCLHGRVSNGESIQVNSLDPYHQPHRENFQGLWSQVFKNWCDDGGLGGSFPFIPELGPPSAGYAMTYPNEKGERVEIGDRWKETLAMAEWARGAFAEAKS